MSKIIKNVIVESPFFVKGDESKTQENVKYARECMLDSLRRGESPFLSHLLYTQVLDDNNPEDRMLGILAGLEWGKKAEATIVYIDRGISPGMEKGIQHARDNHRPIFYRSLHEKDMKLVQVVNNSKKSLNDILTNLNFLRQEELSLLDEIRQRFPR